MKSMTTFAGFIALGVVLGYVFLPVPNVELVTATVFLCGYALGSKLGFLGGTLTEFLYGILNPQGMATPFLLASMMIAMGITGYAGGLISHHRQRQNILFYGLLALTGFACTLNFAVLTTLGYLIGSGVSLRKLGISLIIGLPFYITHLFVNTAIFLSLVPVLIRWMFNQKQMQLTMIGFSLVIIHFWPGKLHADTGLSQINIGQTPELNYRHLGDLAKTLPGIWFRDLGYNGNSANCRIQNAPLIQSAIYLNGFELKDPLTGLVDLRLVPVDMVSIVSGRSGDNVYPGSHTITNPIFLNTNTLYSNLPYSKIVYRTGQNKFSDLDITFGQKFTPRFELISGVLLNNEGEASPDVHHSQQIRSGIKWQPWNPVKFSYIILHNVFSSDVQYPVISPIDTVLMSSPTLKQQRVDHMLRSTLYTGQWPVQLSWHYSNILHRMHDRASSLSGKLRARHSEWSLEQQAPGLYPVSYSIKIENQSVEAGAKKADRWAGNVSLHAKHPLFSDLLTDFQAGLFREDQSVPWGDLVFLWKKDSTLTFWSGIHQKIHEPVLGEERGLFFLPTFPEDGDQLTMLHHADRLLPNLSIDPEKARIADAGMQLNYPKLRMSIGGYYQKSTDVIELIKTDYNYQYQNQGEDTYYGLQSLVSVQPIKQFNNTLVMNYSHSTGNSALTENPKFWGNLMLTWRHPYFQNDLDLRIVFYVHFWSEFYSFSDYRLESVSYRYHPAGYVLNGKISARFMKNAIFSLALDNILDASISFVDNYTIPGRSLRISYVWELFN